MLDEEIDQQICSQVQEKFDLFFNKFSDATLLEVIDLEDFLEQRMNMYKHPKDKQCRLVTNYRKNQVTLQTTQGLQKCTRRNRS